MVKKGVNQELLIKLAKNINNIRDRTIFKIFYETSCKTKDLIEIKVKDVTEKSLIISSRDIPISTGLFNEIQGYVKVNNLNVNDFLYSSRQSDRITKKRVRQIVQLNSKKILGYSINPEEIRKASIIEKMNYIEINELKKQVGLKRLDKRKYLSDNEVGKIIKIIKDLRTKIIFHLLLCGFKATKLIRLKVKELNELQIKDSLKNQILIYVKKRKLNENDPIFLTRQKSSLTRIRIFQIITEIGKEVQIKISPQILNNTALANAVSLGDDKLDDLGIKTRSFHLHGGFKK